jgi:thiamine kinase-like enzyme
MQAKQFDWYDVGTIDNYIKSQRIFENSVTYSIPKTNGEFLYKINNRYIKLSSDKDFINGRVKRSNELGRLVPTLLDSGKHLYSYEWIDGKTLYDYNDIDIWIKFLDFLKNNMWKPVESDIKSICTEFYKNKTRNRLDKFLSERDKSYLNSHTINGRSVDTIESLLYDFDWKYICNGIATKLFHGDLQFDNVIYTPKNKFYLLDWRQDFAGQDIGDVYYDLAKMYGGILMSYKLMKDENNFSCYVDKEMVSYNYKSEPKLDEFKSIYESWIIDNGYDLNKIKTITSLIFLNMAPLHEKEFGDLLFFKSKEMLQGLND